MTTQFNFSGKIALIVGGCSGLGKALTKKFSQCGAEVYSTSRDITKYQEDSFKKENIHLTNLNVTNEEEIKALLQQILQNHQKIDILIYATVARPPIKPQLTDYTKEDWDNELSVNVTGAFLVLKNTAEIMKQQNYGRILTIGSMYGVNAVDMSIYENQHAPTPITYATSKAALIHLTKYFACIYGKHNIAFNCISPGGIQKNQKDPFLSNYQKRTPLGRMAEIEEVIDVILFFASNESSYVTSQNILVDGGWTSW